MEEIQYCASVFVINNGKLLLMYNKKLNKWLQPGGHIENDELPHETAIRECYEETGVEVEIINDTSNAYPEPFTKEPYTTKIGYMIDHQFYGRPINIELKNDEENNAGWYTLEEMIKMNVEEEILDKFKLCIEKINEFKLRNTKEESLTIK